MIYIYIYTYYIILYIYTCVYTPKHIHYQDSHSKMHDHKPHTMFWPWHMWFCGYCLREFERCKVNGWVLGCAFHKSDPMVYNPYTAHIWSHIFRGFPYTSCFFSSPIYDPCGPQPQVLPCHHAMPHHQTPQEMPWARLSALSISAYTHHLSHYLSHDTPLCTMMSHYIYRYDIYVYIYIFQGLSHWKKHIVLRCRLRVCGEKSTFPSFRYVRLKAMNMPSSVAWCRTSQSQDEKRLIYLCS